MQKFTTYIILITLLLCGLLLIYRSFLNSGNFLKIEGRVLKKQIEVVSIRKGNYRYGITFKVDNYNDKLGIYIGQEEEARNNKANNLIEINKSYTFLLDPTVSPTNDINLGIREIRLNGKAILKEQQNFVLFVGIFFTLLCSIALFLIYKFNRSKIR